MFSVFGAVIVIGLVVFLIYYFNYKKREYNIDNISGVELLSEKKRR